MHGSNSSNSQFYSIVNAGSSPNSLFHFCHYYSSDWIKLISLLSYWTCNKRLMYTCSNLFYLRRTSLQARNIKLLGNTFWFSRFYRIFFEVRPATERYCWSNFLSYSKILNRRDRVGTEHLTFYGRPTGYMYMYILECQGLLRVSYGYPASGILSFISCAFKCDEQK